MVAETVRACGGNVSAAAALLTVPPSSLHRRVGSMLAHGLLSPDVAGMLGRGVSKRRSA
jgi:DNA-binding IclR family transcriptional regulator